MIIDGIDVEGSATNTAGQNEEIEDEGLHRESTYEDHLE